MYILTRSFIECTAVPAKIYLSIDVSCLFAPPVFCSQPFFPTGAETSLPLCSDLFYYEVLLLLLLLLIIIIIIIIIFLYKKALINTKCVSQRSSRLFSVESLIFFISLSTVGLDRS